TYRYRVQARDAAGNVSLNYTNIVTASTQAPADTQAPSPAPVLSASTGASQVNLSWTASSDNVGVTSYRVERCTGSSCTASEINSTAGNVLSFTDTSVTQGTLYRYRVRARDAALNDSAYSNIVSATVGPETVTYTYDAKGRLRSVTRSGGP